MFAAYAKLLPYLTATDPMLEAFHLEANLQLLLIVVCLLPLLVVFTLRLELWVALLNLLTPFQHLAVDSICLLER